MACGSRATGDLASWWASFGAAARCHCAAGFGRKGFALRENALMARKKKRTLKLRPKSPARVRKKKRAARSHGRHPELWGLGLVALGSFLGIVLYGGWDGGLVGGKLVDGVRTLVGAATYAVPLAFVAVGALMVARSALVDLRPFRTGLAVLTFGLLLTLGSAHGGLAGEAFGGGLGKLLGPGATILGIFALLVGALLVSGASAGAILRRSGHAVHRTVKARRARAVAAPAPRAEPAAEHEPPVDAVHDFPDVVSNEPPPLLVVPDPEEDDQPSLFDVTPLLEHEEYRLPERSLLRRGTTAAKTDPAAADRIGEALVQTLAHFGIDAHLVGRIAGPRVTRYELRLAPGTKVSKVSALKDDLSYALATTEIRILAPIPGKQAVGVELPNLSPNLVTLGDIFDDLPA